MICKHYDCEQEVKKFKVGQLITVGPYLGISKQFGIILKRSNHGPAGACSIYNKVWLISSAKATSLTDREISKVITEEHK